MTSPTDKRDILDALLKGSTEEAPEGLEILAKMIHRHGQPPAPSEAEEQQQPDKKKKRKEQGKKKTTHYLSGEIFQDLDEAKDKINKAIRSRHKSHITKSKIVDQALKMILKEFEEQGMKSPLIQELLKEIDSE